MFTMIATQYWWVFFIILLVTLFADEPVQKWASNKPLTLKFWGYFLRGFWGILAWFCLTVLVSSMLIKYIFPQQNPYIFSGSAATFWPLLIFGVAALWVVAGPENEGEDAGRYSTAEKRLDGIYSVLWVVAKGVFWLALAAAGILLLFWIGAAAQNRIETMPTSEAIIVGAVIIAFTLYASLKGRK